MFLNIQNFLKTCMWTFRNIYEHLENIWGHSWTFKKTFANWGTHTEYKSLLSHPPQSSESFRIEEGDRAGICTLLRAVWIRAVLLTWVESGSESGLRRWTPKAGSESGLRRRTPKAGSESGLRKRAPKADSESGLRKRTPKADSERRDPKQRVRGACGKVKSRCRDSSLSW